MISLAASWQRAWAAVGTGGNDALFARLVAAYSQPQRRYHTLQHLSDCLRKLESHASLATFPNEVELALWFHDAVYDVRAHDNEVRSATWLEEECRAVAALPDVLARLCALVMVTRHTGIAATADEALLVDIDLSILGADDERFDEYERQVRDEYAWVPSRTYREKRAQLLAGFLARPLLFQTPALRALFEIRARANLRRSITALAL